MQQHKTRNEQLFCERRIHTIQLPYQHLTTERVHIILLTFLLFKALPIPSREFFRESLHECIRFGFHLKIGFRFSILTLHSVSLESSS